MSYRDKCEQLYLENQELKERLKEAKKLLKTVLDDEYDLFDIEKYLEKWGEK